MGIADRVLLLLIVILLPLGLIATYKLFPAEDDTAQKQEQLEQRLETLIQQLSSTASEKSKSTQPIKLSQAVYASDSGTLTVSGSTPTGSAAVLITATVLPPPDKALPEPGKESIRGSKVELVSIQPDSKGLFTYEYPLGKLAEGIVELRFEQKDLIATVRFDLKSKTQVY